MAEKAPALYILQKRIKRGRTLILERNIQAPFAPRGKVSLYFYKGRAQPGPMGRALLNSISTLFHVFFRLAHRRRENFGGFLLREKALLNSGKGPS